MTFVEKIEKKLLPNDISISLILFVFGAWLFWFFTFFANDKNVSWMSEGLILIILAISYLSLGIGLYGIIKSSTIFLYNLSIKIIKKLTMTFLIGKSLIKKVYDNTTNKQDRILKKLDIIEHRLSIIELLLNIEYSPEAFENDDVKYKKIVDSLKGLDKVSVSFIQRKFSIGYARAARFMDKLEEDKIVEPTKKGLNLRKVLKK